MKRSDVRMRQAKKAEDLPVCQPDPGLAAGEPGARSIEFCQAFIEETLEWDIQEGIVLRTLVPKILAIAAGRDRTFVGNDASAGAIFALVDASVWLRQLHLEVLEVARDDVQSIDSGVFMHMVSAEASIHVLLRQIIDVHRRLHRLPE